MKKPKDNLAQFLADLVAEVYKIKRWKGDYPNDDSFTRDWSDEMLERITLLNL